MVQQLAPVYLNLMSKRWRI